jgi:O-antigen/teichoic acid export membrane protein
MQFKSRENPLKKYTKYFLENIWGLLAKNTIWMSLGLAGRLIFQIVYFLIVARTLQPTAYGSFAGALALVTVFSPFVSWGSGNILIEHVSRQSDEFHDYWGMALSVSVLSALLLMLLCTGAGAVILSSETAIHLVLPMSLGMFFGDGFATLASQAFQAFHKLSRTSAMNFFLGFFRLFTAILLLVLPIAKTAENWTALYMWSGLLTALIGLIWVWRELGWGPFNLRFMKGKWKEGFYFAIGSSAQGVYNDIDKTLLLRMSTSAVAGVYTAAYRIMDASFIPVRGLLATTYPHFFKKGEKGVAETTRFALRLLPWAAGWGVIALLGIIVCSPLVPKILGIEYEQSANILLWISLIPLFRSFHYMAADSLTGAGYQGYRSAFQIGVAIVNFGLNLWLIPLYSWLGAAWSSLISDGMLAICLWSLSYFLVKRHSSSGLPSSTD